MNGRKAPTFLLLQRLLGSSRLAFSKKAPSAFSSAALKCGPCPKIDYLIHFLTHFREKIVVFTQFRETQQLLFEALQQKGISTSLFHGGLSRTAKEQAITTFKEENQLLLSTDAGSEGRNLQFCHTLCNFDLPWNPMRIEQRIGRLSRIGQTHEVEIINLVMKGTIEEEILTLLEDKIHLFELVLGELEMIVGKVEEDFESKITKLWHTSSDPQTFHQEMEKIGLALLQAKKELIETHSLEEKILGGHLEVAAH